MFTIKFESHGPNEVSPESSSRVVSVQHYSIIRRGPYTEMLLALPNVGMETEFLGRLPKDHPDDGWAIAYVMNEAGATIDKIEP